MVDTSSDESSGDDMQEEEQDEESGEENSDEEEEEVGEEEMKTMLSLAKDFIREKAKVQKIKNKKAAKK
jgi:hypothetical protein